MAETKAQTKKGSASKRARSSSKSKAKSKAAKAKPKAAKTRTAKPKARTAKPKSRSSRQRSKRPTPLSSSGNGSSSPAARADAARHAVGNRAKGAGKTVGKVASKAKVPLVAGGAVIAGAAGGLALAASKQGSKSGLSALTRKPRIKLKSDDVAKAAKQVGNFSAQVGELATELQRAREEADGRKHRSPVEVVLQGLTARR